MAELKDQPAIRMMLRMTAGLTEKEEVEEGSYTNEQIIEKTSNPLKLAQLVLEIVQRFDKNSKEADRRRWLSEQLDKQQE